MAQTRHRVPSYAGDIGVCECSCRPLFTCALTSRSAIRAEDARLEAIPASVRARRERLAYGPPTQTKTPEHRARISAALRGRAVNGRVMSAEHKARSVGNHVDCC